MNILSLLIIYCAIGTMYGYYSSGREINKKTIERYEREFHSILVEETLESMKNKKRVFIFGLFLWPICIPFDIKETIDNIRNV